MRTPFMKWCDLTVVFVGICVPPPRQPKNNRNADKDYEEQRDHRKRQALVSAAAEQSPHGKHQPDCEPDYRAIDKRVEIVVGCPIVSDWKWICGHGVLLHAAPMGFDEG